MKLHELNRFDSSLRDVAAGDLVRHLPGPTLLHLAGRREPALFVSVLLHGNEAVGWQAIQGLLKRYARAEGGYDLPRSLSVFIGNIEAAAQSRRRLDGQPDYNRVWPGSEEPPSPEQVLMQAVVDRMRERGVFASIDLHNNTGLNPHYACVNRIDNRFLWLATQFSRTVVYFIRPTGVQSQAMAALGPALTLECGKVGQAHGVEHATEFLDACLHLAEIPGHGVAEHDIDLFHTVAQIKVPEGAGFGFDTPGVDLDFDSGLEQLNFRELPRGTRFARVRGEGIPLDVRDEQGADVSARYFERVGGELVLRLPVMPSMLTLNEQVIRQDCLCYLMERYTSALVGPKGDALVLSRT